jgi:hypothetical protein
MQKKDKAAKRGVHKYNFRDELQKILFAFGDLDPSLDETTEALEEYLFDFLDKLVTKCAHRANRRDPNSTKIMKEDVLFLIKDDPKWMGRLADIICKKKEIARINEKADPEGKNVMNNIK